jgi:voltage-gated potassium channel
MQNPVPNIYRLLTILTISVLAGGTVFYHYVEHLSWLDALYFCVITLASVGYGDITPKTALGKIFTIFYIFAGVGIIGAFIRSLIQRAQERRERRLQDRDKQ